MWGEAIEKILEVVGGRERGVGLRGIECRMDVYMGYFNLCCICLSLAYIDRCVDYN